MKLQTTVLLQEDIFGDFRKALLGDIGLASGLLQSFQQLPFYLSMSLVSREQKDQYTFTVASQNEL